MPIYIKGKKNKIVSLVLKISIFTFYPKSKLYVG